MTDLLLQVDVNRQGLKETVLVLQLPTGELMVAGEDLDRWRILRPDVAPLVRQGQSFYPIASLPGATYQFDRASQSLAITVGSGAFAGTVAAVGAAARGAAIVPSPGGFLNYSVSGAHSAGETSSSGLFEAGFFSRFGVLTSSQLAPDLARSSSWVRLETTYTIDQPARMTTLRLGDSITEPGMWGRAVQFGGIKYGTNFDTQPGFIPYPFLATSGQASLPSTVDVFINNALVTTRNVPPGPFSITNIPVVSGTGDMRLVVRDVLGREQVITTPFYGSTTLLRPGLSEYSIQLGARRKDYGVASAAYGAGFGSALYRRGVTDSFTAEVRAEATNTSRAGGAWGAYRLGNIGIVNGSLAVSDSDAGRGKRIGYGFERQADGMSIFFQESRTDSDFRLLGLLPDELPERRQTAAGLGFPLGNFGSLSVAYALQEFRDRNDLEAVTLNYSLPLGRYGQLGLNGVRTAGAMGGTALFAYIAVPLGPQTTVSASYERSRSNETGITESHKVLTAQKSLPVGDGYGYYVQARDSDIVGNVTAQNGFGTYLFEASRARSGDTAYRVTASGGVGTVGGHVFLSRVIDNSFGVVRVDDYPGVRVLHDNQVVARTNGAGYAVLPGLRPYDLNPIGIEQADLPFDAKVDTLKLQATPYFRSGVLIEFPVRRVRAGTLRVVLEDGRDIPSGAVARFEGGKEEFPIALQGEAYLEGFEEMNRLHISWKGQTCVIDVPYPRTADPLPNLGRFTCRGLKP